MFQLYNWVDDLYFPVLLEMATYRLVLPSTSRAHKITYALPRMIYAKKRVIEAVGS